MFGWEFPPHIAGGLGTACEGIVKGLAHNGVETLFVMPSASGDEDQSATTILNASDVEVQNVSATVEEFINKKTGHAYDILVISMPCNLAWPSLTKDCSKLCTVWMSHR